MNPDKPFELRGGNSQDAALHNRIAAIKRIEFLTGVDLSTKSTDYMKVLDLEMWKRWYHTNPRAPLSEEFCQRVAEVIHAMEGKKLIFYEEEYDQSEKEFNAHTCSESNRQNAGQPNQQSEGDMREGIAGRSDSESGNKSSSDEHASNSS